MKLSEKENQEPRKVWQLSGVETAIMKHGCGWAKQKKKAEESKQKESK